jgi:hypothetical protein
MQSFYALPQFALLEIKHKLSSMEVWAEQCSALRMYWIVIFLYSAGSIQHQIPEVPSDQIWIGIEHI